MWGNRSIKLLYMLVMCGIILSLNVGLLAVLINPLICFARHFLCKYSRNQPFGISALPMATPIFYTFRHPWACCGKRVGVCSVLCTVN